MENGGTALEEEGWEMPLLGSDLRWGCEEKEEGGTGQGHQLKTNRHLQLCHKITRYQRCLAVHTYLLLLLLFFLGKALQAE